MAPPGLQTPSALALAALGVLVVALLTRQPDAETAVPSAAERAVPSAAAAPSALSADTTADAFSPPPNLLLPSRNPAVTPRPTFGTVAAGAGPAELVPAGQTDIRLTISLPTGWGRTTDAMYVKAIDDVATGISLSAWQTQQVHVFPCRWSKREFAAPPFRQSIGGQATALSSWWGQDPTKLPYGNSELAPLATRPSTATFHGRSAWYVAVLIPRGLDLAECDGGQLLLWETADRIVRSTLPGELHRLWIVDVAGEAIVFDAASFPDATVEDLTELQAVVDSIDFEP